MFFCVSVMFAALALWLLPNKLLKLTAAPRVACTASLSARASSTDSVIAFGKLVVS